jgi:hypothetical protein
MLKLTCYQCHNTFASEEESCPHCGAVRKENPAQTGVRLVQRFVKGAIFGGIIGVVFGVVASGLYILYGHLFLNLVAGFEWDTIKYFVLIALVCGILIGGLAKIVRPLLKED